VMDYVFRRLALDHLPYDTRSELGILSAPERAAQLAGEDPGAVAAEDMDPAEMAQSAPRERQPEPPARPEQAADRSESPQPSAPGRSGPQEPPASPRNDQASTGPHSSTELLESRQGRTADAPLCLICGTKMRPAGSCYVCEGCGATSGCS
jgi:ribonucleoside-diphosphate reductase alpha chain